MQKRYWIGPHIGHLLLGALVILAMLLAGCGTDSTTGSQLDAKQLFIWPAGGASVNDIELDPANVQDYPSMTFTNAIYGGLVTSAHNLTVQADMARSWDISPDGLQY